MFQNDLNVSEMFEWIFNMRSCQIPFNMNREEKTQGYQVLWIKWMRNLLHFIESKKVDQHFYNVSQYYRHDFKVLHINFFQSIISNQK
jgi:hypothetical protein